MNNVEKQRLEYAGIDVDKALDEFMGNEVLLRRFLDKFKDDQTYSELLVAFKEKNPEKEFVAAHTMKGVCKNLFMVNLSELLSEQVELLRIGQEDRAALLLPFIIYEYEKIITILNCII